MIAFRKTLPLVLVLAGLTALSSCSDLQTVCDLQLVAVGVRVINEAGDGVPNLKPDVTVIRTGTKTSDTEGDAGYGGYYGVINDLEKSLLAPGGDWILFQVLRDPESASGLFYVGSTPDGCHVAKILGPDSVVLRRSDWWQP